MPAAASKPEKPGTRGGGRRKPAETPLSAWMRRQRVSQEQLAREVGCTQGAIAMIANGQRSPRKGLLDRLIQRTRLTAGQILGVTK